MGSWIFAAVLMCSCALVWGASFQYPFQNPALPLQQRLDDLMSRLTYEEMVNMTYMADVSLLIQGDEPNSIVSRLGINTGFNWMGQNAVYRGVWNGCNLGCHTPEIDLAVTVYPQGVAFAATFNKQLIFETGVLISNESRAMQTYPTRTVEYRSGASSEINLMKDGRWGRCAETYGECPILTGTVSSAFNKALIGYASLEATEMAYNWVKVIPVARSFGMYNGPDAGRFDFDAITSDVDIRLTYARAWQIMIENNVAMAFMTSINAVNGVPDTTSNYLINDLMRDEYGFPGYFMSDCDSVANAWQPLNYVSSLEQASAAAVNAGVDLSCSLDYNLLVNATAHQLVESSTVETAVERLLRARFMSGDFDPPSLNPYANIPLDTVNSAAHFAQNRRFVQQSVVLLENDGVLPINAMNIKSIAVIGPNANDSSVQAHTYHGTPSAWITMTQSITNVLAELNPKVQVTYAEGCDRYNPGMQGFEPAAQLAQQADVTVLVVGNDALIEEEDTDRSTFHLPGVQMELVQFITLSVQPSKPVIVIYISGGPIAEEWISSNANALMWVTYFGQSGEGIADVLFGNYNPSARMPYTIPRDVSQLPPLASMSMIGRTYRYLDYKVNPPLYPFGYGLSWCKVVYHNTVLSITTVSGQTTASMMGPAAIAHNYTANLNDIITVTTHLDNLNCAVQSNEVVMVFGSFPLSSQYTPGIPLRELMTFDYFVVPAHRSIRVNLTFSIGDFSGSSMAPSLFSLWLGDGQTPRYGTSFNITVNNGGA